AVERRDRAHLRTAVTLDALPHTETPGLERRAVRRRRELEETLLRRQPRLAVELPRGRRAEVAGRRVDDPVGKLDEREHLLLHRKEPGVLRRRVLDARVRE